MIAYPVERAIVLYRKRSPDFAYRGQMYEVSFSTMDQIKLKNITEEILGLFKSDLSFKDSIPMTDYHGFEKGRIPSGALEAIASKYSVTPDELQAEFVSVTKDLSDEVHIHHNSRAYCIILGEKEGLAPPKDGYVFLNDKWFPARADETIDIPPKTKHGFTVKPAGILHFLSVQTPPIEDNHGHDDYERIKGTPSPF
jgi:mannose-6-phosphate isomerase-like protein (cupin superfamily)